MEFLKLLESIRFPALDWLMQAITTCGEELVFMAVALVIFWCVDKWRGYYILSVGFVGTILNQFLKLLFRVPRPWVRDPSFTIVDSAKSQATGYSFPSGHTQNAVGTFGGIARSTRRKGLRWAMILLAALVSFSRMYLGAHYPSDVGVALVMAVVLLLGLWPVILKARENPRVMYGFLAVMTALSLAYVAFVKLYSFPAEVQTVDPVTGVSNYHEGLKNAYSLLGALLGLIVAYTVDLKKLHFSEKAPLPGQICKVVLGLAIIVGIRALLKKLFGMISDDLFWNAPRYFCMVVFAGAIWPLSFPFWARLGQKK